MPHRKYKRPKTGAFYFLKIHGNYYLDGIIGILVSLH